MKILEIIVIYFSINLGLRIIINFGICLLISIMCLLIEPIDKKIHQYIKRIIEHRLETEVKELSTIRELNIKNIFKLLIKGLNYLISEKYINPSKIENSALIKFGYNISKLTDKLYYINYKLVFNYEVLRNGEKLKHCIKVNLKNFKYCIKGIFKIRIFNLLVIVGSYYYFIDNSVIIVLNYVKNFNYIKFINYITLILPLPIIKTIYTYTKVKLLLKNECDDLKNKYICLFKFIKQNIEKLNLYKIENEIECIAEEITNDIGFKFEDGKLKVQNKHSYPIDIYEKKRLRLESIMDEINKIDDFIKDKFVRKNIFRVEQCFLRIPYFFEGYEKKILDYKAYNGYKKIYGYFKKNHNQIYKRKFTNVRVVEENRIIFLDSYIANCENWLKDYRNAFTEYILNMLILDYEVKKHLTHINRILVSTNFTDVLKTILGMSIMEYLKIIKKILY